MEIFELEPNEGAQSDFSKASRPRKYITSAAIYYCTFCLGVSVTFLGPTVIDFSRKFNTDVSHVAIVFTILLVSYLVGALLNGIFSHFLRRQVIVLILFTIGSTALCVVPHVTSIQIFFTAAFFMGFFAGGYDSAQVAWIIDIWRHEAPPFILTQHFFYSVGTIVPPLILAPFLKGQEVNSSTSSSDYSTNSNLTLTMQQSLPTSTMQINNNNTILSGESSGSDLWIPFTVAGSILAFGLFIQSVLYFGCSRPSTKLQATTKGEPTMEEKPPSKIELPECKEMVLIALSCCFISFYTGMEWVTMQFLPTFTHFSKIHLTEAEGANVLSGLTIAFCIFRGLGIFIVLKVPPHFILAGNLVLLTVANALLLFFADGSVVMMWGGSILLGVAFSTTFPAYFAYIEKYLFISDSVAAVILVCAGGVSAVYPLIVGGWVQTNPTVMIYVNFVSLSVLIVSFTTTFWLTFCKSKD